MTPKLLRRGWQYRLRQRVGRRGVLRANCPTSFGSFRCPKQGAISLGRRPNDTLHDVAAKLSLADRLNRIVREVSTQYCFEFKFKNLAL